MNAYSNYLRLGVVGEKTKIVSPIKTSGNSDAIWLETTKSTI